MIHFTMLYKSDKCRRNFGGVFNKTIDMIIANGARSAELAMISGTLSNGDAKDKAKKKNEFIFYRRISQMPRSV